MNLLAIGLDDIILRIRFCAELRYQGAIYRNAAFENHLLGFAPRSHAGMGENLLKPFLHDCSVSYCTSSRGSSLWMLSSAEAWFRISSSNSSMLGSSPISFRP